MRRLQIQKQSENRSFPIKLQSNKVVFKTSIDKIDSAINTVANISQSNKTVTVDTSPDNIETKTDINNHKPEEDIYYDEIVYYDGGGVEGYGD